MGTVLGVDLLRPRHLIRPLAPPSSHTMASHFFAETTRALEAPITEPVCGLAGPTGGIIPAFLSGINEMPNDGV